LYLLITAVLTVLAYNRKHQVDLHQRVRDSLLLRHQYAQTTRERAAGGTDANP
jgi:hypothetical protein